MYIYKLLFTKLLYFFSYNYIWTYIIIIIIMWYTIITQYVSTVYVMFMFY